MATTLETSCCGSVNKDGEGRMFWMENGKKKLLLKSKGTSTMVSGFMCAELDSNLISYSHTIVLKTELPIIMDV